MEVPDRDEEIGALADGVSFGVPVQWRRQDVFPQSPPDQDWRLRV